MSEQSRWVPVAKAAEVVSGRPKLVEVGNVRIALFKLDDGFHAIEDVCTHDEGPVAEGPLEGDVIECPRHGAKFNIKTGNVLCMPAITPIRTFPARLRGTEVELQIEE